MGYSLDTWGESVQQSIEDRLKSKILSCKILRIDQKKISGDGTFIGNRIHVINVTFTLQEEGNASIAADGNHTIAISKCKKDYDHLSEV
jgi:hypothetical protein